MDGFQLAGVWGTLCDVFKVRWEGRFPGSASVCFVDVFVQGVFGRESLHSCDGFQDVFAESEPWGRRVVSFSSAAVGVVRRHPVIVFFGWSRTYSVVGL